jgi:hypothetical protein
MAPPAMPEPGRQREQVAESGFPIGVRRALIVVACVYLLGVFFEGIGKTFLQGLLYRPFIYFAQVAALFPRAATHSIEYRVEGYRCDGHISEIDVRPYFPIHADDKESRFDRAMHFFLKDKSTLAALAEYITDRYNREHDPKVGGVILLSLRIPIPSPGSPFPRYERTALSTHPKEQRKIWYDTPRDVVMQRCAIPPPPPSPEPKGPAILVGPN